MVTTSPGDSAHSWNDTFRRQSMLALLGLLMVADIALAVQNAVEGAWPFFWLLVGGLGVVPFLLWLIRAARLAAAGNLIVGATWVMLAVAMTTGSGLWSVTSIHLMLLVILAGLLLGGRGLVVWSFVAVLTIAAQTLLHLQGHITLSAYTHTGAISRGVEMGIVVTLGCAAMLAVQHQLRQTIHRLSDEVTERRRAEERALEAARSKERFLATISHELRTPLNGILGASELMKHRAEGDELVGMVSSSADLLLTLVNDILDYSRMAADAVRLEALPVAVAPLLAEVTAPLVLLAQRKGVRLTTSHDVSLPAWVVSDPTRLRQVLLNLTSNAVKFTDDGEITVRTALAGEGRWSLVVADTGLGISAAAQASLFEPFVQADVSTTRQHGGTGLGLAIVARIVGLMGGQVTVDSAPGRGSTFTVTLPLVPAEPPAPIPPPPAADTPLRALRVLVVDDHPINRLVASRHLAVAGHHVGEAADGEQALALLQSADWDMILMDCQMPVCDGYDATRAIRRLPPPLGEVIVIGLSANAMAGDRQRAIEAGMDDYLTKPIRPDVLHHTLRRWSPVVDSRQGKGLD